jgi:uncharacterized protein YkwD
MTEPRIQRQPRARLLSRLLALLALPALAMPLCAVADVIDAVNALRYEGCGGNPGGTAPLRESAKLDEVAHRLSQGTDLRTAEQFADYHAVSAFSVSISGVPASGNIEAVIARQYCEQLANPAFREFGAWRRASVVWIALAEPFSPPAPHDQAAIGRRILALTNAARAHARRCGPTPYAAVAPLRPNGTLTQVALRYAQDMATYGYMSHTGHDGSTPQARITRGGYRWREIGENLASGIMTPEEVVAGWLASPDHCANLMDPLYTEAGAAFSVARHREVGVYWAMEFGTPGS